MRKVQRIYETTQEINFISPQKEFSLYWRSFQKSELGQVYRSIPWHDLAKDLKIRENKKGPCRIFSPQGMLALMFLKHYVDCSDKKLIDSLNGNLDQQMFCGVFLGPNRINNYKIVSEIRCFISKKLDVKAIQKTLAKYWKPYMKETQIMLEDATCYETSMRYPTNVKLLWECTDYAYNQLKVICKYLKIRLPRSKFEEQREKYNHYSHKRKKTQKETNKRIKSLLYLLGKLLKQLKEIEDHYQGRFSLPEKFYKRIKTIQKVLKQQQEIFETGKSVSDRIVSISKSYIRPIVRGKEVKPVEFGAKVNMIQFDGINFIEHLSFKAFNEGIRLKQSVGYGRDLVGKITHIAADDIYANNANRKYCTSKKIVNNFKRKGRAGKYEEHRKIMSRELRKERSTRMEGSFGTEKEYYGLKKIKARTELNEILLIFFGVHTANAVRIAKRLAVSRVESQSA
ncbi:MAG: DDE transposase [Bacteroidales bacterium]|nr:DDE transposase [Bacteroidales bacterium]